MLRNVQKVKYLANFFNVNIQIFKSLPKQIDHNFNAIYPIYINIEPHFKYNCFRAKIERHMKPIIKYGDKIELKTNIKIVNNVGIYEKVLDIINNIIKNKDLNHSEKSFIIYGNISIKYNNNDNKYYYDYIII